MGKSAKLKQIKLFNFAIIIIMLSRHGSHILPVLKNMIMNSKIGFNR